jgi:hypothetical protein
VRDPAAMDLVTVEDVTERLEKLLGAVRRSASPTPNK